MSKKILFVGVVNANPRGFGFVTTEDASEYFVTPNLMKTVVPGDRITFELAEGKKPGELQVSRILKVDRPASIWLGELEVRNGRVVLVPDDPCFISIEIKTLTYVAPGQVVAVRIPEMTDDASLNFVTGTLAGILGARNSPLFDQNYALAREDLKIHYSPGAIKAANNIENIVDTSRADMRNIPFVTIDGESTKDFDDAVAAEILEDGFLVHVAIADVSAYVKSGSALDREVRARGCSVYLPELTVPMLPLALSAGVCSLNPGLDRLALVCSAKVSFDGELTAWSFQRATIRSHARLTYTDAYQHMTQPGSITLGGPLVEDSLNKLAAVYQVLSAARKVRGVLDFNDKEPRLVTNAEGLPDLVWEARNDAHKLVEELMLLANQAAAAELAKRGVPAFYRHQQAPDQADWTELRDWLKLRGIALAETPSLKNLAMMLNAVKDQDDYPVIEMRARNIMQFAVYDTYAATHFSLGYGTYTHFTSPIRRYSDLLVHRILLGESIPAQVLKDLAVLCSDKAKASRMAERFVWDRLKKRILVRTVPKTQQLDAHIVAMNRRGIKVVFDDWQCAAFIPADSLTDAGYTWNADNFAWSTINQQLEPGSSIKARWHQLEQDKSRCELSAVVD